MKLRSILKLKRSEKKVDNDDIPANTLLIEQAEKSLNQSRNLN